jgi:hypothetical protein
MNDADSANSRVALRESESRRVARNRAVPSIYAECPLLPGAHGDEAACWNEAGINLLPIAPRTLAAIPRESSNRR